MKLGTTKPHFHADFPDLDIMLNFKIFRKEPLPVPKFIKVHLVYILCKLRHMKKMNVPHRQKDHIKISKFTKFGFVSLGSNQAVTCQKSLKFPP